MMPTGSDTRGRRRGAKARRAPDTSPVPSHATPRALDSISAQVAAYAKRERKNAVEAARLHADLLTSENVPSLALKYSNYLSPSAKRELLARLKPGVGKAKEAWSTARASLTGWVLQFTENASDWRSMPVALKVAAVDWS